MFLLSRTRFVAQRFRPFDEARNFARQLGFGKVDEWRVWNSSGVRPFDIPGSPWVTYKHSGWAGFPDW